MNELPYGYVHIRSSPEENECVVRVNGEPVCKLPMVKYASEKVYYGADYGRDEITVTMHGYSDSIIGRAFDLNDDSQRTLQ